VFVLEDLQGSCEVVMFPRIFERYLGKVEEDAIVFVRGKVDTSRENPNLLCEQLMDHEGIEEKLGARVVIDMDKDDVTEERISRIQSICTSHKGKSNICLNVKVPSGHRIAMVADRKFCVKADTDFVLKLREAVKPGVVELKRK
jgi:DNA polymerase-3 subunit alpha